MEGSESDEAAKVIEVLVSEFEFVVKILEPFVDTLDLEIIALEEGLEVGDTIELHHIGLELVLQGGELLVEFDFGGQGVQTLHDFLEVRDGVGLEFQELVHRGFTLDF